MNNRFGDDDYDVRTGEKKKPHIVTKILKWTVYLIIIFIYSVFMIRIFTSCDPKETKMLLVNDMTADVCSSIGEDNFVLYKIKSRNSFGEGDTMFLNNVVYLESSGQLQFTIRYKKKNLILFREEYKTDETIPFKMALALSDKDNAEKASYTPDCYIYQFETSKYYYQRVNFENVNIEYARSKIELFVNIVTSESEMYFSSDSGSYTNDDYLARFTLFDINTSKDKARFSNFTTKLIN